MTRIYLINLILPLLMNMLWGLPANNGDKGSMHEEMECIILSKKIPFKDQMHRENTIYEVRYDYDLGGSTVIIPQNCVLRFKGGILSNGTIVNCGRIENVNNHTLFRDIIFLTPIEQFVKLDWFDYKSDSDALENAAKFKHVDATGTWTIDKTVIINNDIQIENGVFKCLYGIKNITISSTELQTLLYKNVIKEGTKELYITASCKEAKAVAISSADCYFKTERNTPRNGTRGEVMLIDSIYPDRIVFNTNQGTVCDYSTKIKLAIFKPLKVSLRNCSFYSNYKSDSDKGGLLVEICYAKANVSNCYFRGCSVGLKLDNCINSIITASSFENIYPWASAFSGGTCNSTIIGCTFDTNKHAWTTLGEASVVKNCQISGNVCRNSLLAICPHANAYGVTISNNLVNDSKGGIGSFAPNIIIKDNTISNLNGFPAIYLTEAGGINPIVQGNVIENCKGYGGAIRNEDLDLTNDVCCIIPTFCEIKDNVIRVCPDYSGIICDYSQSKSAVTVSVTNNTVREIGFTGIKVESSIASVTGNEIYKVLRTNYTPITVVSTEKKKSHAIVVRNQITFCEGEENVTIKGFDIVDCFSNLGCPERIKEKFENCKTINNK